MTLHPTAEYFDFKFTQRQEEFLTCKPSRLLEMAVEDIKKLAATPGYVIDMGYWVSRGMQKAIDAEKAVYSSVIIDDYDQEEINDYTNDGYREVCYVCLGGAALVGAGFKGTYTGLHSQLTSTFNGLSEKAENRTLALNAFRCGEILNALCHIYYLLEPEVRKFYSGPSEIGTAGWWKDDPEPFYESMQKIIDLLKSEDL